MPALNFKKQFAEDVELGVKKQTIRAPRKDGRPHCRVGDTIKLYTGMRTKQCRLLGEAVVIRMERIRIDDIEMFINGHRLPSQIYNRDQPEPTDNEFAQADGFEDFMSMADWFRDVHGLPFEGTAIYWDEPR